MERRPGQILKRHDLAEDNSRLLGDGMLRPSPNHGTLRLPTDDDDDDDLFEQCSSKATI